MAETLKKITGVNLMSPHGANSASGPQLRAGDIPDDDTDADFTKEAFKEDIEHKEAEKLAAAMAQIELELAQGDKPCDTLCDSSSSSSSCSAGVRLVQAYPMVPGTCPEQTWDAVQLQSFVLTPPVFDRFNEDGLMIKLGIAPASYHIDLLNAAQQSEEIAAMVEAMNYPDGVKQPTLTEPMSLYDAPFENTAVTNRFCKWYTALPPAPTCEQMTRTLIEFQCPVGGAHDTAKFVNEFSPDGRSVPITLKPGCIEKTGMTRFTPQAGAGAAATAKFADRKFHSIPVAVRVVAAINTTGAPLQVELCVPNMCNSRRADDEPWMTRSESIGFRSDGARVLASSATAPLNRVCVLRPTAGAFNSPEARRWSSVDLEAELAVLDDLPTRTIGGQKIAGIRLTDAPATLAEMVVIAYAPQLIAASVNAGVAKPKISEKSRPEDGAFGYIKVPIEALRALITHMCEVYSPAHYAVNQSAWQLRVCPTAAAASRFDLQEQKQQQPQQPLTYTLELIQLPYNGPHRLSDADCDVLDAIEGDYDDMEAYLRNLDDAAFGSQKWLGLAGKACAVAAKKKNPVTAAAPLKPGAVLPNAAALPVHPASLVYDPRATAPAASAASSSAGVAGKAVWQAPAGW